MKFRNVDKKRLVLVILSVIMMGFCLSFLNLSNFGTDPCTCMNLGISSSLKLTLGTWQALLNCFLFLFVIFFDRGQIGWGTVANMFLVGYSFNFFSLLNSLWMPEGLFDSMVVRIVVAVPALLLFVLSASVYMALDLGTAPFDAVPMIIASKVKGLPFRLIRMLWDIAACAIGFLFGCVPGVLTIAMALTLGPVITWVKVNVVEKHI